ncbi:MULTISPECIES: ribonuclease activity regulator RraA [unclassified Burkholderia]|uniref:ribonuclease activity regulator RraA n=1 Tax=unclassified Burkholderia TaxID=2613784 RepID=UPI0005CEC383|nr:MULTISPECIES: ribonuclease activity regulator RraA [unclassified Burkholderia]TGN98702.1 ribonuclease activity regulator RraA [Burkholderia sp. USMB20]
MKQPNTVPLSAATRELLEKSAPSTIANVLLMRHGLRNTVLLGLSPVRPGMPRMVGPAYTLRFIPAREDIDTMENYQRDDNMHRRAIEECPSGAVLVIDAGGSTRAASAGDIMVARLAQRGVRGIVTDGGFRDTPSIARIELPAFQLGNAPPATPLALHPQALDEPIGCAGVAIYPGDILVGDDEGVVAIPSALADEVAEAAHAQSQYEQFVETQIPRGRSIFGLFPSTAESRVEYERWVAAGRPDYAA